MMKVAFVNENMLGHGSYLPPYVRTFRERPHLGIAPFAIDAVPLPPRLAPWANTSVRGLRRWGLDFHVARWRRVVSHHVRRQLVQLCGRERIEAVVVNTQSVALDLLDLAAALPLLVCLDATFAQLSRTAWFAANPLGARLLPLTLAPIRAREAALFRAAHRLLPWSDPVRESLEHDYGVPAERISRLPPSVTPPPARPRHRPGALPQILFIGGDFRRKGGEVLLDCFREHFSGRCELHLVTQSPVAPEPGVFVHRGVAAYTPAWRERWERADVFVFPSSLDTFGIVLLEALAFGVPVVATDVGAARDVLADGTAGVLLPRADTATLAQGIAAVLNDPARTRRRVELGRRRVATEFDLAANAERLAGWLRDARAEGARPRPAGALGANG